MDVSINDPEWEALSHAEKNHALFLAQKHTLELFLERGAIEISSAFTLNQSFSSIQTGIILFFLIGSEFFVSYRIRRSANTEAGKEQDK